jgi:hypothetical protein
VEIYSINTLAVDVQVGVFGAIGTLFDTEPSYVVDATLNPGWNTIDLGIVGWDMTTSFLIGHEFSSTVTAGLDGSGTSDNSYSRIGGGWTFWGDDANATGLPHGDWGIRANVTYNSPNVTYNVYQDGLSVLSNLSNNSATATGLNNNETYSFHVTANFDCGESDPSGSVEVTPQPQTTVEVSHEDDGGMPGDETFSAILANALDQGWNTHDLSSDGLTVSGTFWVGTKGFSSTQGLGIDTDSNAGASYTRVGAAGDWTQVEGNLMIRIFVDGGEVSCGTGDTNGDDVVNVLDIVTTVNGVLSGGEVTDCANDMNGDGVLNVLDIVSIVNLVLGG